MRLNTLYLLVFISFFPFFLAQAQYAGTQGNRYVKTELLADKSSFQPRELGVESLARLGVRFKIEPGWHIYWKNSGESAVPTSIDWQLPEGWSLGPLQWPSPEKYIERGNIITYGYSDEVLLFADLYGPPVIPAKNTLANISARVRWLVCKDVCVPGESELEISRRFSTGLPEAPAKDFAVFEKWKTQMPVSELEGIKLEAITKHDILAAGSESTLALVVSGFAPAPLKNLYEHVQVFPYASDAVNLGPVELFSAAEGSAVFKMPLSLVTGTKPGGYTASGILLLSSELLTEEQDRAIEWKQSFVVEKGFSVSENTAWEKIVTDAESLGSPKFREHDFQKKFNVDKSENLAEQDPLGVDFLLALLAAFLGGLLLNLMPCVLPIISIKVFGFLKCKDQDARIGRLSAYAFSFGVLSTMLVLALLIISLKSIGIQLGWGFQFQHPGFVLILLFTIFVLSLGFFEMYSINLPGLRTIGSWELKFNSHIAKNFFDGVIASILSTPCTAPFLGTALAFAFTQTPAKTIAIFLMIGLGLSLPYAFLSTHPKFLSILPKPGPWMSRFRQLMGIFLLGTGVWLLFVLHHLSGEGAMWGIALLFTTYCALWVYNWLSSMNFQGLGKALAFSLIIIGAMVVWPKVHARDTPAQQSAQAIIPWRPYSESLLSELVSAGQTVFIDFTATWCITCKANEYFVIEDVNVARVLEQKGIVPLKADWTNGDAEVTQALKRYGGHGVPYYVLLSPKLEQPLVLPTLLTQQLLLEAFADA